MSISKILCIHLKDRKGKTMQNFYKTPCGAVIVVGRAIITAHLLNSGTYNNRSHQRKSVLGTPPADPVFGGAL
jgi:hypothetical protein